MVKTGGIKTQKPEKSMFRTNANNVLRQQRLLKYTVVFNAFRNLHISTITFIPGFDIMYSHVNRLGLFRPDPIAGRSAIGYA